MSLTSSDISRIANLARLELDAPAVQRMQGQLSDFFDIVQAMRAVDTTGIQTNAMRPASKPACFWYRK